MHKFKKCDKPDCLRLVHEGTLYCCSNCRVADEGPDRFELTDDPDAHPFLRHSNTCDERAKLRVGFKVGDYEQV